jgi:hypothetical protein
MDVSLIPDKPGQICKVISRIPDMEEYEVYIVSEDPADFDNGDDILVFALGELQRNIMNPYKAERIVGYTALISFFFTVLHGTFSPFIIHCS